MTTTRNSDTIVAIATPSGVGGIAVVRLSGPSAAAIARPHLEPMPTEARRATFALFTEGETTIDEVVVTLFSAPHSYTGEETVEISCHGSRYVQQAILQCLIDSGARLAEPGEFTMRAFLNGRLNLSQAEAVADLIDATTPVQHRLAVSQLRGGYADELRTLRGQLLDLTSLLELELDFSQEDVEFVDRSTLLDLIAKMRNRIYYLCGSFEDGNALKQGIRVAIVGEPNAGKSTLLNALLQDDRAIVSPIAGTTRDTIEELLTIGGLTFRLIDTAGLRHSDNPIEQLGIDRSRQAIEKADMVLVVADSQTNVDDTEWLLEECSYRGKKSLLVVNKADLCHPPEYGNISPGSSCYYISAQQGKGLDELKQGMVEQFRGGRYDDVLLTNARHRDALQHIGTALDQATAGLEQQLPADLVAVDLRDALYHLGTITGDVTNDELLGNIFSRFCVGK